MNNNNKSKILIFGKYEIIKKIGEGSFGKIYLGFNRQKNEKVAIKLEAKSNALKFLKSEAIFLFILKSIGIPKLKAFGQNRKYNILVETLLGKSLSNILKIYKNKLPLKDTLMIAIQVLERLEYLHSKFLIHRDIKPENFLIGYNDPYIIYLIDFGLCKKYRSNRTGKHVQFSVTKKVNGTPLFASLNTLKGYQVSRRDDLESVAYMLIYLMKGGLPWDSIKAKSKYERYKKILKMKIYCKPEILCKDLPNEIKDFFLYCRSLNFEQEPDYNYLNGLFNNALTKLGFYNDLIFSWIKDPKMIYKLKHIKMINNSKIRNTKRKSSPQMRIFHSLQNSFIKRQSSNNSLENSELINFTTNSLNNYSKRNLGKYQFTSNSLVDTLTNDESLKMKESIKSSSKLQFHKKYRKIFIEQISGVNSKRNLNISNKNSLSKDKNNTFQHKSNNNIKSSIPFFKLDTQFESRNLKNNKELEKTKKIINYNYINTFSNNISNSNDNYLKKIQNLPKRKTELILRNIKKLMQNKNKSNFINIINNNNINSNINMLLNIQPKSEIKRNNRGLNKSTKISEDKLKRFNYRPISTKMDLFSSYEKNSNNNKKFIKLNSSDIKSINKTTNTKQYSSITELNSYRNFLNKKFDNKNSEINSINVEVSKNNKLKLKKINLIKLSKDGNLYQNNFNYNDKTLSKSYLDNLNKNTPIKRQYNPRINYFTSKTIYRTNRNNNLNYFKWKSFKDNMQNKYNFDNYTINSQNIKPIITLKDNLSEEKQKNYLELNKRNAYTKIKNMTSNEEISKYSIYTNQRRKSCLTSKNSTNYIKIIDFSLN